MHRAIMLSGTYQMSTQTTKEARELDPGNRLNSRFNLIRMSVEEVRDSVLAVTGNLDTTIGGSLMSGQQGRKRLDIESLRRRTLYIPVRRGSVPSLLSSFDFGDATTSSEGRPRTNVAPQALYAMNSGFVVEQSKEFAKHLLDTRELSDKQRIEQAYVLALTRRPASDEIDQALSYIGSLEKRLPAAEAHLGAWQSFCHALLASNEFLYLN